MPSSKEIWDALEKSGWVYARSNGDHFTFKHPNNQNLITVVHPRKDNPIGYVKYIEKVSGLRLR